MTYAQTNFPEFSLSTQQITTPRQIQNNQKDVVLRRALTRDILVLQEQINILEALVSRQAEIGKIADSFEKMGVPFIQPTPELSACKKLPFNLLCLYGYPDLEEHQDVIKQTGERMKIKQQDAIDIAIEELSAQLQNENFNSFENDNLNILEGIDDIGIAEDLIEEIRQEEKFVWSDIQCIQSKCSALFISTLNNQNRIRANAGDKLNDKLKISMISPLKITALSENEIIEIAPLPLDGIPQKTTRTAKKTSNDALESIIASNTRPPELKKSDIKTPTLNAPKSVNTPNPQETDNMLGPTGLF